MVLLAADVTWPQVVTAICALGFGLGGFMIALNQWYTNKTKLKVDLFELRWPIFSDTAAFLRASSSGEVTGDRLNSFIESVSRSEFLFDKDIYDYLNTLHIEAHKVTRMTPDKISVVTKHWEELGKLKERFKPYLDFNT